MTHSRAAIDWVDCCGPITGLQREPRLRTLRRLQAGAKSVSFFSAEKAGGDNAAQSRVKPETPSVNLDMM